MATLIARADGNLTDAATWALCDGLNDSESFTTNVNITYAESSAFTVAAGDYDGIAVKVSSRVASPTGTISVRLAQAGVLVAGTEVTLNNTDIMPTRQGWMFFKFAAPVTLAAATNYTVSVKSSVAFQFILFTSGSGNWSRMLRSTTTQAPAAGDSLHITGEWTGAGVKTNRVVTMDSTATTDYGSASATIPTVTVGNGGSLPWANAGSTSYHLKVSGMMAIYRGGAMTMGTVASPCPRSSTMTLEFDSSTSDEFGLLCYGTLTAQGLSRTDGKNIVGCLLNTDEAAAQTVLGVDTDTGWLSGDEIAIAGTTQTPTQAETRTLASNAGASSMTVSSGLTNAHSGTSPTQAMVVLITRNVVIRGASATNTACVHFGPHAVVDCDWVLFRYLGGTGSTPKRCIETHISTDGSMRLSFCAFADFERRGLYCSAADWGNVHVDNLSTWKVGHTSNGDSVIEFVSTTVGGWSLHNLWMISGNSFQGNFLYLEDFDGDITNLRCANGGGQGVHLNAGASASLSAKLQPHTRTWDSWNIHNCREGALRCDTIAFFKLTNVRFWRNGGGSNNNGTAVYLLGSCGGGLIENGEFFGNLQTGTGAVGFSSSNGAGRGMKFRNITIAGDTSFGQRYGVRGVTVTGVELQVEFENCTFGVASGIFVGHFDADFDLGTNANPPSKYRFIHCRFASTTQFQNFDRLAVQGYVEFQNKDQVAGAHEVNRFGGVVSADSATFRTAAPSEKLAPSRAGFRLESSDVLVPVESGASVSIACYVRKSAPYNGVAPRLMLAANPALGITTDVVIASMVGAAGQWELLSGASAAVTGDGVLRFYVDCDGTAGQVNVDDWSAT